MRRIQKEDITGLRDFITTIEAKIEEHGLDQIFNVRKKFVGPLGEAKTLIKLYEELGDEYEYLWYGARRRDHDLVIRRESTEKQVQIKTSSMENWAFSITVKGFDEAGVIRTQLRKGDFTLTNQIIEKDIKRRKVDFWVFLHEPYDTYYVFDNEGIIQSIEYDYHRYVNKINIKGKAAKSKYAIVNNYVRSIQKKQYLAGRWEDFKENWNIIRDSFTA